MIPGIGNSAQTVSKTIAGSAVLVKNSIGVAAVIVMAVIIGIPLLKLVVMALLYQILGAVLEPVADSRIVKAVLVLSGSLENMIYMIAVTVPVDTLGYFTTMDSPTVGLSGLVFALFGSISFEVLRKRYYQLWMLFYLVAGFLFPGINAVLHLWCYVLGLIMALLNKPVKIMHHER